MPNNLPFNWCECKLVDTCDVYQPKTISTKELVEDGKYTVYGANGIIGRYNQYNHENSEILITCRGATCGTINKSKPFSWINGNAMVVHPFIKISSDFLFYYLNSVNFKPYISGSAQPQITRISLQPLSLPLPPLAEQERIVEKIEALFADIDEGVERLKSAQAQIKQYRQSVLKFAFEGKLYKTTDWKEVQLKDVCDVRDGTHDSPKYVDNGYPLVTSKNLKNGKITTNNLKYITEADYNKINERSQVEIGDVLFAMIGTIGNPVVIVYPVNYAIKNVALLKKSKIILPFFIKYFLDSTYVQKKMLKDAKGSTQKFVPLGYLRNFKIVLPSLPEQQRIVEEIEKRFAVADELEKAVNEGLEKAEKLKQSILKKAFEGKLVPQDPNDEPASVLLARIKKENQSPTKGRKK